MKKIVLFIMIILLFGLAGCKKNNTYNDGIAYNEGLVLKSENKLYYSDLKSKMRLIDSNDANPSGFKFINNHLFYNTTEGFIYHIDLKSKDNQAQRLMPTTYRYFLDNTGTLVTYLNENTIYQIDLKKSTDPYVIATNITNNDTYFVSSDGKKFIYSWASNVYTVDRSKDNSSPQLVLESVSEIYPTNDLSYVLLLANNGDLYSYKFGKEAEFIDSGVIRVIIHNEPEKNFLYAVKEETSQTNYYLKAYKNGKIIVITDHYRLDAYNGIKCYYEYNDGLYYFDGSKSHLISKSIESVTKAAWKNTLSITYKNTDGTYYLAINKKTYYLSNNSTVGTLYSDNNRYLFLFMSKDNGKMVIEKIDLKSLLKLPKYYKTNTSYTCVGDVFIRGKDIFYIDTLSRYLYINNKYVGETNSWDIKECNNKYYYLYNKHLYCISNYKVKDIQDSINEFIVVGNKVVVFKNTSDVVKGVCVLKGTSLKTIGENIDNHYLIQDYKHFYW